MDTDVAKELVRQLSFSDYVNVEKAINADDLQTVANILGVSDIPRKTEEGANSYATAQQSMQPDPAAQSGNASLNAASKPANPTTPGNQEIDLTKLHAGDKVRIPKQNKGQSKEVTVKNVNNIAGATTYRTNGPEQIVATNTPQVPNKAAAEKEIQRIKQLAGIEDKSSPLGVEESTFGVLHSASIAGAVMPKNELKNKLRKLKPNKKPGPKPRHE
jgi:hypothetical protein